MKVLDTQCEQYLLHSMNSTLYTVKVLGTQYEQYLVHVHVHTVREGRVKRRQGPGAAQCPK